MKKIAILINESTMERCSCGGCLGAFNGKKDAFARYEGDEVELVSFTHSGGDLEKKINTLKKKGVYAVHLSSCTKTKNENYEDIAERLSEEFEVVGYTHGDPNGKDKAAIILSKKESSVSEEKD